MSASSLGGLASAQIQVNFTTNEDDYCNGSSKADQRKVVVTKNGTVTDEKISSWNCCRNQRKEKEREKAGIDLYQRLLAQNFGPLAAKLAPMEAGICLSLRIENEDCLRLDEALNIQKIARAFKQREQGFIEQAKNLHLYVLNSSIRKAHVAIAPPTLLNFIQKREILKLLEECENLEDLNDEALRELYQAWSQSNKNPFRDGSLSLEGQGEGKDSPLLSKNRLNSSE